MANGLRYSFTPLFLLRTFRIIYFDRNHQKKTTTPISTAVKSAGPAHAHLSLFDMFFSASFASLRQKIIREPLTIHNAGRVERSDKIAGSDFGPPEAGPGRGGVQGWTPQTRRTTCEAIFRGSHKSELPQNT